MDPITSQAERTCFMALQAATSSFRMYVCMYVNLYLYTENHQLSLN